MGPPKAQVVAVSFTCLPALFRGGCCAWARVAGPDKGAEGMRYLLKATAHGDTWRDLAVSISALGDYTPHSASWNGLHGDFAVINQVPGHSVRLRPGVSTGLVAACGKITGLSCIALAITNLRSTSFLPPFQLARCSCHV